MIAHVTLFSVYPKVSHGAFQTLFTNRRKIQDLCLLWLVATNHWSHRRERLGGRFMTRLAFTYTVVVSYLDLVPKCSLMLSVDYFNLTRVNLELDFPGGTVV